MLKWINWLRLRAKLWFFRRRIDAAHKKAIKGSRTEEFYQDLRGSLTEVFFKISQSEPEIFEESLATLDPVNRQIWADRVTNYGNLCQ